MEMILKVSSNSNYSTVTQLCKLEIEPNHQVLDFEHCKSKVKRLLDIKYAEIEAW